MFLANSDHEDEGDVPMAQRKRFTRVEMARVLMERNQVIQKTFIYSKKLKLFFLSIKKGLWSYKKQYVGKN